ncbi:hypothetical protein T265_01508 [Opisthorchis viverrini]|uniref:Uncharacterized protein n=1 Tax=Opisthorchis viverrini TaxID=6198 RepID=A0A074ZZE7_OPIVI|nr:hypothetical protein T265_01508 [Opisthorchis viverrini]KER32456.1 hypothetical protein T265_01508 [Opisthorchis viverrini]
MRTIRDNFRNSRSRLATWYPPTAGRTQTQIDCYQLWEPGSISALMLPSGGIGARLRKNSPAEPLFVITPFVDQSIGRDDPTRFAPALTTTSTGHTQDYKLHLLTVESPDNVCCTPEKRTQHPSNELTAPSLLTRLWLRTAGNQEAASAECAGVGLVPSCQAEKPLIDCMYIGSPLCGSPEDTREGISQAIS